MAELTDEEIQAQIETNLLVNLQKITISDAEKAFLQSRIAVAKKDIARWGITLDLQEEDDRHLVEEYAAWLYRRRAEGDSGMPRMLDWLLKCRLLSEKMKTEDESDAA